MNQSNTESQVK